MLLMSPILIENELAAIANYKSEAGNFQVKASKVAREVTATYEKDEMSLAGTPSPTPPTLAPAP